MKRVLLILFIFILVGVISADSCFIGQMIKSEVSDSVFKQCYENKETFGSCLFTAVTPSESCSNSESDSLLIYCYAFATDYNFCEVSCNGGVCVDCIEDWNCGVWSECLDEIQTRICTDLNSCGTIENKPIANKVCTPITCKEGWDCGVWSECLEGEQTRVCTDLNNCGTEVNKPEVYQECYEDYWNYDGEEDEEYYDDEGYWDDEEYYDDEEYDEFYDEDTFELGGQEVTINKNEDGTISIDFGNGNVIETSLDMIKGNLGAYLAIGGINQKIEITPEEAIMKADKVEEVGRVEIEPYKSIAVYSVYGTRDAKLFFIIPKKAQIVQKISVEKGRLLDTELPWWRFFALGV
ncbi:MAG: hypothetical protein ABIA78_03755 [archaeon]